METIILKTIRSVVVFCAALFALAARAADYYWTGHAGNNLWHDRNNWSTASCSDAAGVNVPSDDLADQTTAKTYVFAITSDTVITADVNVVAGWLYCGSTPTSPITIKIVSADGKKFRFAKTISGGQRAITADKSKNVTFELNVDMSSDTGGDAITVQGNVIFNLTAANTGSRPISFYNNNGYKVSIADGSVPPVFSAMSEPSASTIDLGDPGIVVGTAIASSETNDFSGLVVANGGTLSFKNERAASLRGLPVGGTLAVDRSEALVSPGIITRLMFDDASDPLKDYVGQGSRLAATGSPTIVDDATRGKVMSFNGLSSFSGHDENNGIYGFNPSTGYTIAMWIKPGSEATQTLVNFGTSGTDYKETLFRLFKRSGKKLFPALWHGGSKGGLYSNSDSSKNAADGNWHHVALTFDGSKTITLYYDGAFDSTLATGATAAPDNRNFQIGSYTGTGGGAYTGLMDDVLVMNGAMSAEQIASLYSSGLAATVPAGAVKADGSGTVEFSAAAAGAASISGNALGGGIRLSDGATFRVGADAGTTASVFKGGISGGGATLVKDGADYSLTLAGQAAAVTNLVVSQGVLALSRPASRPGAAAQWSFEDANDFGADSGAFAFHLVQNGSSSPSTVSDGVIGKAAHFDGACCLAASGDVNRPSGFPDSGSSFSVSFWIRPDESCNTGAEFFRITPSKSGNKLLKFAFNSSLAAIYLTDGTSGNNISVSGLTLADGNWHYLAVTYDKATSKRTIYVDGVQKGTNTKALLTDMLGGFVVAAQTTALANPYKGDMDEFTILDYAMTAEEVAAEYSRAVAAPVSAETAIVAPVAHWAFDGDASESVGGIELSAVGTVTYETGDHICGQAARFDGSQSFSAATFPSAIPTGTSDWTAVARFKPDTDAGDHQVLWWGGSDGSDWKTRVQINSDAPYSFRVLARGRTFTTPAGMYMTAMGTDATRWINVAVVSRSNYIYVYVDGELYDSASGSASLGSETLKISDGFKGLIDDIRIYDKALTAAEVRTIADALEAGCTGASPTSVLTASPDVAIASGATLKVASVENVNSLSGAGTVVLSPNARLTVGDWSGFSGNLSGAGQIGIANGSTLAFGDGSSPILATSGTLALGANVSVTTSFTTPGNYVVATATGFSGVDNLSTWTAPNLGGRKYRFILSSDGQVILRISAGMIIVFK